MTDPTRGDTGLSPDLRRRLDDEIAAYLLAADAGRAPEPDAWLASRPEAIRPALAEFLADHLGLANLVDPLRAGLDDSTLADTPTGLADAPTRTASPTAGNPGGITIAFDASAPPDLPRGSPVRYFGDYEIRDQIGRGGMGVVYRARQISLNRLVAIKMIRAAELADEAMLRRFQNEAEAVALLDHPGIVPVYEVGDHGGQPYFSMKLIEGGSLSDRLASYRDDPRAAAALMAEVAEAVGHAHLRGVLHRDLKPANILIDDQGRPHVTDFGLAKQVAADSEITQSGAILGTPAYMSPEQANGRRGAITTVSDVYGLGAVLYAMLTGRAPFRGESVVETLTQVREQPPEPPSRLNARVPRDLEVIGLKCLEKDPRRRYLTAQALADDLRAWLDGRPIAARPVSAPVRAWMWCRRRPALAATLAALVLALVGGTATVLVVQSRANANLRAAFERERDRFELALEAIKTFHEGVSEEVLLQRPELDGLRRRLLDGARDFYRKMRPLLERGDDPRSRFALAQATYRLALINRDVGSKLDSIAGFRTAESLLIELAHATPDDPEPRKLLSQTTMNLGNGLRENGGSAEAADAFRRVEQIERRLLREDPADLAGWSNLGSATSNLSVIDDEAGRDDSARRGYLGAIAIYERILRADPGLSQTQRDLGTSYGNLGALLAEQDRSDEALAATERSVAILEELVRKAPQTRDAHYQLILSLTTLGSFYKGDGQAPRALQTHERARDVALDRVRAFPTHDGYRYQLACCLFNVANTRASGGQINEALAATVEGRARLEELVRDHPTVLVYRNTLAKSNRELAALYVDADRPGESFEPSRQSEEILLALLREEPRSTELQTSLFLTRTDLGRALLRLGRADEAIATLALAREPIASRRDLPSIDLYDLACNLAMALSATNLLHARPDLDPQRLRLADQAVATLRLAVEAGFDHPLKIALDADLTPLHPRDDFHALLAMLFDQIFPSDPFAH